MKKWFFLCRWVMSVSLMGIFYTIERIFIRHFLLYTSTMLISILFIFSLKKMGGGYHLARLFYFGYCYCCLFIYTLPPSQKYWNQPTPKGTFIYIGKIKCLSDYHITQKCWDRLSLNLEDIFEMIFLKRWSESEIHFQRILGSAAKR